MTERWFRYRSDERWRESAATSYQSQHEWLRVNFGAAREHRCTECPNPADLWALTDEAMVSERVRFDPTVRCWWSPDGSDYLPVCTQCHGTGTVRQREVARACGRLRARRARGFTR